MSLARRRVLLDVDTGVDDALALLLAFGASDRLDVAGVSCVAGNGSVDAVCSATLRVLDAAGAPSSVAVARGFAQPLLEATHFAPFIHGTDCLGDLEPPLPASERQLDARHAVQFMADTLRSVPEGEQLSLVALAPLTNVAILLRTEPELCEAKLERIFWMGGAVGAGNHTACAEANAAYDPEAAAIVLGSGLPLTMYTWDSFLLVEFTGAELDALAAPPCSSGAALAARLMRREMKQWKKPTALIGDAAVVAGLLEPAALRTKACSVRVELAGTHTRGMTVVDQREFVDPPDLPMGAANVDVVMGLDADVLKRVFASTVFPGSTVGS